jgi:4-diphosphocytidyl-2-C-methyl-D-erythritol kinase
VRLSVEAPAKINRELRVGRMRSDGYHEVFSRMISIDLADRLSAEPAERLEFSCDDPRVPTEDGNLVVRAARLLAERAGIVPRVRLRLEKKVPMGGGLGGGSADAGVALLLLSRFWNLGAAAQPWLSALAATLGSDVAFFLTGGQADVAGRGEIVTAAEDFPETALLLLVPPFQVSTAAVYRAYAGRGVLPSRLVVADPAHRGLLGPNDLAPAVLEVEARMEPYLSSVAQLTNDFAISGSGATIALVAAPGAKEELARRHPEARIFSCRSLTRHGYRLRTDPVGPATE